MVALSALWLPIIVAVVLVFVVSAAVHMIPGWHQDDMTPVPGEDKVMETLRGVSLPPGEYRFPFGRTTKEMEAPEFVAKMKSGPVGTMTIRPAGEINMGKLFGSWILYTLVVTIITAYVTSRTRGAGTPYLEVFRVSGTVAFCSYALAHWQGWIWWGKSTRITLTYTIDGLLFALVTAGAFGWLWPR